MKAAGSACAKVYLEGQDPKTVLEDLEKDLVSKFGK